MSVQNYVGFTIVLMIMPKDVFPMFKGGQLFKQSLTATNDCINTKSRLFYITDKTSNIKFLVDTGASVSIIP